MGGCGCGWVWVGVGGCGWVCGRVCGLSSRECIAAIQAAGGQVVAAACIVDRSGGRADVGVPLVALATLDVPAYAADALPPELAALPVEDPGSRRLSGKA